MIVCSKNFKHRERLSFPIIISLISQKSIFFGPKNIFMGAIFFIVGQFGTKIIKRIAEMICFEQNINFLITSLA